MLVGVEAVTDPEVAVSGGDAAAISDTDVLFDGHPASPVRFTWPTGTQTTSTQCNLTVTSSTDFKPRVMVMLAPTLPVGTLVRCRFDDGTGEYTLDPGGNSDQRIVALPYDRRAVWMVFPQPAAAIGGFQLQIFNDVDGAANIAAGAEFEIGQVAPYPAVFMPLFKEWEVDPADQSRHRRSWGQQLHTVPKKTWRRLSGRLVPTHVEEVRQEALDNDLDWELVRATLAGGKRGCCIPRWTDGAGNVDAAELHRNALYGFAPPGGIRHAGGDWYEGPWAWEEIPP